MQFLAQEKGLTIAEVPVTIRYPDQPKRHVLVHGMQVLNGILHLVGQHRPLFYFGVPGTLLLSVGIFSDGMGNGILGGAVYAAGAPGLLYGGVNQFAVQVVGALASIIWAFVAGFIVFKLIDVIIGLRASEADEVAGLDITEHGIRAYPEYITE